MKEILMKTLKGTSLAGTSMSRERVDNDFYATPPEATEALLLNFPFFGTFLEPCVGEGHIAKTIYQYYEKPIKTMDIVDRGFEGTVIDNFLTHDFKGETFDNIITNPPYTLAQEFAEKSLSILSTHGQLALFLKIQFLEGLKRREFFKKYPPKYIAVFSNRQNPLRNGSTVDENGKPWSSTMCFAWFIWERGFTGEPAVKWLQTYKK